MTDEPHVMRTNKKKTGPYEEVTQVKECKSLTKKNYSCIIVGKRQINKYKHRYTTPCDFGAGRASPLEPAIKQRDSKH